MLDQSTLRALALVSGLGFGIALPLGIFFLGGLWLDGVWGTQPLFMLVGIVIGLIMAGLVIAELLRFQRGGERRWRRNEAGRPNRGRDTRGQ